MTLKEAERHLRYYSKLVERLSVSRDTCHTKEKEGKGENIPPAPPIESKGKEEKTPTPTPTRARVREDEFVGPTLDEVEGYAQKAKINIAYATWWYSQMDAMGWSNPDDIGQPIKNWKTLLRNWWKRNAKCNDNWVKAVSPTPPKYSPSDWSLCSERCKHFDARTCRCRCGVSVPPASQKLPRPPEECERFEAL